MAALRLGCTSITFAWWTRVPRNADASCGAHIFAAAQQSVNPARIIGVSTHPLARDASNLATTPAARAGRAPAGRMQPCAAPLAIERRARASSGSPIQPGFGYRQAD